MGQLKLRPHRLLVFSIVGQRKYKGLFTPQTTSYADYYELKKVWIADMGPECNCVTEGVGLGSICYLIDMYELDSQVPFSIMKLYGDKVNFRDDILEQARSVEGLIEAHVIHENSLVCIAEESCQRKPRLSWDSQHSRMGS